jgi:ABC-type glycerol-3-phosphate transport system substrate-binding protein
MTRVTRREFLKSAGMGAAGLILTACGAGPSPSPAATVAAAPTRLQLWSFWASEEPKKQFFAQAIQAFNDSHPNLALDVTWYETDPLLQALRAELAAASGNPDTYYADPGPLPGYGVSPWVENGYAADLTSLITLANLKPIDAESWTYDGKLYGFPIESGTLAIYVNLDHFDQAGVEFPSSRRMTREEFTDAVRKLRELGKIPMGSGTQDWGFTGGLILTSQLLRNLGLEDMPKLYRGEIAWTDSRVRDALQYAGELVQMGVFPVEMPAQRYVDGFLQFSRGDASMYSDGPWFLSRAYNPVDQGGLPEGTRLGVMDFPTVQGSSNNDLMMHITGGSFLVNAYSAHIAETAAFWEFLNNEEWGRNWIKIVHGQTGIRATPTQEDDPVLYEVQRLEDASRLLNPGCMEWALSGDALTAWTQVVVGGYLAGQATMEQAIEAMDNAAPSQ